ncbi:MAG: exo-alpha-sialidase [Bacteroidetes bacterium]|nr:exo-alpha-sialidase [Bacteroidota bacterium]
MIQFCYKKRLLIFVVLITISLSVYQKTPVTEEMGQPEFRYFNIPLIDLTNDLIRQVIVDKEEGQYLGHPTTVLLEDNKTIYCVYPKGHGCGAIVMKRSDDAGLTWSERLATPKSWETSKEVPTIYRVIDPEGIKRLIMFSGLYPIRMAVSEDDGKSWSELEPIGDFGGIVAMGCLIPLRTGKGNYMALFHDDMRFITRNGQENYDQDKEQFKSRMFTLFKTFSYNGGLTWSYPEEIVKSREIHICEPGIIRSPDGSQLAVLLRENSRSNNSQIIFSNDEGKTWTPPRPLPNALTGDRHVLKYAHDGRLVITFRDISHFRQQVQELARKEGKTNMDLISKKYNVGSPTEGDWVAWVGTYQDLVEGNEGQYRLRIKDNTKGWDTSYPGLELLLDGTFIATTYGHWDEGEQPYILSVRFKLEEIDELANILNK